MARTKSKKNAPASLLSAEAIAPRQRVLEAAIDLFAERGFDAVTVRDITARAGTNLAAINYYFESKENLIRVIFKHAAQPFNALRLDRLTAYESSREGMDLELEPVIRSLIEPIIRALMGKSVLSNLAQIYAFCVMWPPSILTVTFDQGQNDEVLGRYIAALARALPDWSLSEVGWGFYFATGAIFTSARDMRKNFHFRRLMHNQVDTADPNVVIERLVIFLLSVFNDRSRALRNTASHASLGKKRRVQPRRRLVAPSATARN